MPQRPVPMPKPTDPATAQSRIQIVSITGLTGDVATAEQAIMQQLRSLQLPSGISGKVVFEVTVQNGRLVKVIFDDVDSALQDQNAIETLKRSLQNVVLPSSFKGTMRLTLNVQ
jgi:Ca-activated chloride channel family protein